MERLPERNNTDNNTCIDQYHEEEMEKGGDSNSFCTVCLPGRESLYSIFNFHTLHSD